MMHDFVNPDQHEREERELKRYHAAVSRVRRHNPGAPIQVFSSHEILRLEQMAARLETAAGLRDIEGISSKKIAEGTLNELLTRHGQACRAILGAQRLLGEDSRIYSILGVEPSAFDSPLPAGRPYIYRTDAEIEQLAQTVAQLEIRARRLGAIADGWMGLSPEKQNRRLCISIADRLDKLADRITKLEARP
jgi:hypothetical protein